MILSLHRVMAELACTEDSNKLWAMHSIADAVHDGGRAILDEEPTGIGFAQLFVDPLEAGIYDEEVIKTKLIKSLSSERQREETFLVRTDTALSPVKGTFQLAKTCNTVDKTLVYQDAGPTVYDLICNGANALNPGSVCDPASRSLDNAVFTKSQETLRIDGCVFGFDKDIVPAIILKNFTGKTVVCGVQYRNKWYDMAAGKEVGGENEVKTVKHINKPAGFLSGNGVNGVLDVNTPNVKLFYIGKLLGDALQVITMLETINNTRNPYYQIKAEGETQLINTPDRLQYARAVYLGVGALLTFKKGDTKQAAYTPGAGLTLDDAGLKQYYISRIKEARTTIKNRFDEALRSMGDSLLGPGDSFRNNYSKVDGYIHMVSSEEKERAKNFMERCAIETVKVRKNILDQFKEVDNLEDKNPDQLKTYYQFIHSRIASQSPGGPIISGSGYNTKGNITNRFKIAITETNDYIIDFRYAFKQMEDGAKPGDPYGGTNKWLKEGVKRAREQDEAISEEEPSEKRAKTAGKRKGRKGTFRKKGGKFRVEEPATEGVKAVTAFTSHIYAYETRRIGFDEKGELVMVPDDINRFWKQEETKSTEYKTTIQVPADEAKEIEDGFDYVPPEGVTVTWKNILEAALKEDEDSLLAEFIRFLTGREELTSDAFLTAKVLIEDAVESGCKKGATKVQDIVILETLDKQLDLYLYSLTGVPEIPSEGAKEAPEEIFAAFSSEGPEDDNMGEQAKPIPEPGSPPRQPMPQSKKSTPGNPIAPGDMSGSEASLGYNPPPPPPAPGTDPRGVAATQRASQGGKRRTRRMKRLFR